MQRDLLTSIPHGHKESLIFSIDTKESGNIQFLSFLSNQIDFCLYILLILFVHLPIFISICR